MDKHYVIFGLNKTEQEVEKAKQEYESNLQIILDEIEEYIISLNLNYGRTLNAEKDKLFELVKYFDLYLKPPTPSAYQLNKIACDKTTDVKFNEIANDIRRGEFDLVKARLEADFKEYKNLYQNSVRKSRTEKFYERQAKREQMLKEQEAEK